MQWRRLGHCLYLDSGNREKPGGYQAARPDDFPLRTVPKATLASLLARAAPGLRFNEHLDEADGPLVFAHACKLGLEGICSPGNPPCKRLISEVLSDSPIVRPPAASFHTTHKNE
jgi:hypothetical protein